MNEKYVTLSDGHKMPRLGLGIYKNTDKDTLVKSVASAYEAGYRLFDTAQMYGNEAGLGEALKLLDAPRNDYFVTTKVAEENQGYTSTIESVKDSLHKLQLDYVDLLLVHWPIHQHFFSTWHAFEQLKKDGLAVSIGVSNFGMAHLQLLEHHAKTMPVLNQIERHPLMQQEAMIKYNSQREIITQAWAPLGRGRLMDNPILLDIAESHKKSVSQVILRWQLQSNVSVIPKSIHPERIKENIDVFGFDLSKDEMAMIGTINSNHRLSQEPELVYELGHQYPHN